MGLAYRSKPSNGPQSPQTPIPPPIGEVDDPGNRERRTRGATCLGKIGAQDGGDNCKRLLRTSEAVRSLSRWLA